MRKVLILCTTYYQLIMAISIRREFFKDDEVSLALTDGSRDAEQVCDRLRKVGLFRRVIFLRFSKFHKKHPMIEKISDLKGAVFGKSELSDIGVDRYDLFLYHHLAVRQFQLFSVLQKMNPNIACGRFEEGILSYPACESKNVTAKLLKAACSIRRLLGKPCLCDENVTRSFYCCFPEFYKGEYAPIRVPFMTRDAEMKQLLCDVFAVDAEKLQYKERYIMLTSVLDFEGEHPIGEYELVNRVSELVGKDDLIIKTHPRDRRTVYEDAGYHVDKNSGIPWEVIQMVADFTDKVLLTVISGSVLSINICLENATQTYLLYELSDWEGNLCAERSVVMFKRLLQNDLMAKKGIHIAHDLNDIPGCGKVS